MIVVPPGRLRHAAPVPALLHLNFCRDGCVLTPGVDDNRTDTSSIVAGTSFLESALLEESYEAITACVQATFEPFGITVTTDDPGTTLHHEAIVAGDSQDIGWPDPVAGLSNVSADGSWLPNSLIFAFAGAPEVEDEVFWNFTCNTVAHELGHTLGLDHEYICSEPTSYLEPCDGGLWPTAFVDQTGACGEYEPRATCTNGSSEQNSYRHLARLFDPTAVATTVGIVISPTPEQPVAAGFIVEAEVTSEEPPLDVTFQLYDEQGLLHQVDARTEPPWDFTIPMDQVHPDADGWVYFEVSAHTTADPTATAGQFVNIATCSPQTCAGTCEGEVCVADPEDPDDPGDADDPDDPDDAGNPDDTDGPGGNGEGGGCRVGSQSPSTGWLLLALNAFLGLRRRRAVGAPAPATGPGRRPSET